MQVRAAVRQLSVLFVVACGVLCGLAAGAAPACACACGSGPLEISAPRAPAIAVGTAVGKTVSEDRSELQYVFRVDRSYKRQLPQYIIVDSQGGEFCGIDLTLGSSMILVLGAPGTDDDGAPGRWEVYPCWNDDRNTEADVVRLIETPPLVPIAVPVAAPPPTAASPADSAATSGRGTAAWAVAGGAAVVGAALAALTLRMRRRRR